MARSIVNLSRENRHHDAHQMADALGDLLIFIGKQSKLLGKQSQQQLDTWRKQIQARRQALFWGQTALAMMIGLGLSWVASGGIRQRLRAWISRSKASSAESDVVEDECREFAGRNILVVDDGAHNRRLTATIVAKWGARIWLCSRWPTGGRNGHVVAIYWRTLRSYLNGPRHAGDGWNYGDKEIT